MKEKLSALVDDELDHHEQVELLNTMSTDEDLVHAWYRYHLISAVFKNVSFSMTTAVATRAAASERGEQSRIVDFPARNAGTSRYDRNRRSRPMAIAASIAALAALGVYLANPGTGIWGDQEVAVVDQATRWHSANSTHEDHLNALLVEHGEFTSMSGLNGLMSYAKFVSYDVKE